jgi:xanthine dehydrogenase YagS FAD-binding subunit
MKDFAYVRPTAIDSAIAAAQRPGAAYLAGGTNLIDLVRAGITRPEVVVDISALPLADIEELPSGAIRIGALVRNSDVAAHPLIRQRYPMLAQAMLSGASPQLRNMATVGGNVRQRTRCNYFYDLSAPCNKRRPGSGCSALAGFNREHAVLGVSDHCIATHPSDMCVALAALDAVVAVQGTNGRRLIPIDNFHLEPGADPGVETALQPGELITAIELPPPAASVSVYRKVRDRASFSFALVSVAATVRIEGGTVRAIALGLGGVATRPWRGRRAEGILASAPANNETFMAAADAEMAQAITRPGNAFKVPLARRAIVAVLRELSSPGQAA